MQDQETLQPPRKIAPLSGALLLPVVVWLSGCTLFEFEPVTVSFKVMGTQASLILVGGDSQRIDEAGRRFREVVDEVDAELSVYKPDSVISRLNREAGIKPVEVSPRTLRLLEVAKGYGERTGGAFDVTVGPVLDLWRLDRGHPASLPSEPDLRERLALVDYSRIELGDVSAFLPKQDMSIDLGGIGKGYAVDVAWRECRKQKLTNFMVDIGGNIRVSGEAARRQPWTISIRSPFEKSSTVASLAVPDGWAVASSGQYEQSVWIEGRKYGHIIDPRTGYPASGLAGVTVLAPDAMTADALSTSLFVLGPRQVPALLKETRAEAVFIPDKEPLEVWITQGIAGRLTVRDKGLIRQLPESE
jgi:FAD:protein FMN transferase